jgi:hypothetical protein
MNEEDKIRKESFFQNCHGTTIFEVFMLVITLPFTLSAGTQSGFVSLYSRSWSVLLPQVKSQTINANFTATGNALRIWLGQKLIPHRR